MASARTEQLPIVEPANVKNLDPPMFAAPYPAGFPMRADSPRLLSDFSQSERTVRQVASQALSDRAAILICSDAFYTAPMKMH